MGVGPGISHLGGRVQARLWMRGRAKRDGSWGSRVRRILLGLIEIVVIRVRPRPQDRFRIMVRKLR